MGIEIERKFLVKSMEWRMGASGTTYCQGYLSRSPEATVRVRIEGDDSFLTIKGPLQGIRRAEYEYPIPFKDAEELIRLCVSPLVIKTRYEILYKKQLWEVDEFHGENDGLILAEIELTDPDEPIKLPPWIGEEVSSDTRYYNSNLATHPFTRWHLEEVSSQ